MVIMYNQTRKSATLPIVPVSLGGGILMSNIEPAMSHTPTETNVVAPSVEFNPLLPEFIANPHPFYHRLRAEDPVHRSTLLPDTWILTRHSDVGMVLRDPRFDRHDAENFFRERFGEGP